MTWKVMVMMMTPMKIVMETMVLLIDDHNDMYHDNEHDNTAQLY